MNTELCVFDLETTSANPAEARIVSAYLGVLDETGAVRVEQEWLVRPEGFEIPAEASAIHGISHEHATAQGSSLVGVVNRIGRILHEQCRRIPLAGQNISYDLTVLDREVARVIPNSKGVGQWLDESGAVVLDSLVLDKELHRYRKGSGARRLINLAAAYGVHLTEEEAHGARADAIAAGRIVQAQLRNPKLSRMSLPDLHQAQIGWKREQAADLQKYFRTKGGKPDAIVDGSWPYIPAATAA